MNILAIGCHPDDVEIACAGTLAKCVQRGDRVIVCHASTGNLGHVIIPPDELSVMRANEAKRSGALAGFDEVIWGGFDDLEIYDNNKESRDKVVKVIKHVKPDFIITHDPDDYMPDHVATAKLVFDAAFGKPFDTVLARKPLNDGALDDLLAIRNREEFAFHRVPLDGECGIL